MAERYRIIVGNDELERRIRLLERAGAEDIRARLVRDEKGFLTHPITYRIYFTADKMDWKKYHMGIFN